MRVEIYGLLAIQRTMKIFFKNQSRSYRSQFILIFNELVLM